MFSTNARKGPQASPIGDRKTQPVNDFPASISITQVAPVKPTKTNTDSGYHGLSEDETDPDENVDAAKKDTKEQPDDRFPGSLEVPGIASGETTSPSMERATTTEGSFHSAREAPNESEDAMAVSEPAVGMQETQPQPHVLLVPQQRASPQRAETGKEDPMDIVQHDDELALDEPIGESRSLSQSSSPFEPLVRKSSLTFAALPAPEPWTTKKSLGARISRTSHLDQTKNTLGRSSYLGRFTGGKSLGASKQLEGNHGVEQEIQGNEMDLDEAPLPAIVREESDGDTKMTRLHNKSSTQRLHEKINMLGQSQPARPTKSIPANAALSNPPYPELPLADLQTNTPEQMPPPVSKLITTSAPEDDDDDWIQPPAKQPASSKRPQLPKSMTADVMENIRGKQHIGDDDFEPGSYDNAVFEGPFISRQPTVENAIMSPSLARSTSAAVLGSPERVGAASDNSTTTANQTSDPSNQPISAATPSETPAAKRNVDGPISASKSKLQSIMKTARGLFTSSAGVSAQAKIEALSSPTTRSRGKLQENLAGKSRSGEEDHTQKQAEGRKTRSSTEKEERRKQQEATLQDKKHDETLAIQSQHGQLGDPGKDTQIEESELRTAQTARPTRQSPRRLQKQPDVKAVTEEDQHCLSNVNGIASGHQMGPPQAQPSQLQKPKELRRPVKPAKEAASKPKPQTIRVGALSQQRIPLSNSALSSSLQESLPPAQASRPGLVKKASNASIQTSASNTSLKSSTSSKPKALIAAERKKEQVTQMKALFPRSIDTLVG